MGTTKPNDELPPVLDSETGPVPIEAKARVIVTPEARGLHVEMFTLVRTHHGDWKKVPMADAGFISWDVIEEAKNAVATGVLAGAEITRPEGRVDPATLSPEFAATLDEPAPLPVPPKVCTCVIGAGSFAPTTGAPPSFTSERDCPVHGIDPDDIPF